MGLGGCSITPFGRLPSGNVCGLARVWLKQAMPKTKPKNKPSKAAPDAQNLLLCLAKGAGQHGWHLDALRKAGAAAGFGAGAVDVAYPLGVRQMLADFSAWATRQMTQKVTAMRDFEKFRVREKVAACAMARFQVLKPYVAAVEKGAQFYANPFYAPYALLEMGKVADEIWHLCGDHSTDFNFYTKRGLLVYVLMATTFFWVREKGNDKTTAAFLTKRLDEVVTIGSKLGKLREFNVASLLKYV